MNNNFEQDGSQNYAYQKPLPPYFYEKVAVKNTANKIGIALLVFFGASYLIPFILIKYFKIDGNANLWTDPFINLFLNIILTLAGFLGGGILLIKLSKEKNLISYNLPKKGTALPLTLLGIGFCYMANVVTSILQSNLSFLGEFKGGELDLPSGGFGFAFSVIAVAIFPALLEEFLFRGAIMGSLLKFGKPFAIFTSAVFFGLIHGNLVQIPFAFMVGIILGYAVVESGSLWVGVLIHFINNFISVCIDYLQDTVGTDSMSYIYNIIILLAIGLGFLGLYLLCRNNKNLFVFPKTRHTSTPAKRFWWTMSSGTVVLCIVLVLFEIFIVQAV